MPHETTLIDADTDGLGPIRVQHPPGTFALTIASRTSVRAIAASRDRLRGTGLDWGSGVGVLAIAAAHIPAVDRVYGLELEPANVRIAAQNAETNGVTDRVGFFHADGYAPFAPADAQALDGLCGGVDFIIANPPSSEGDDGFGFRRIVLAGAAQMLVDGGCVLLSISSQYGRARIDALTDSGDFAHAGIAATTDWVPFDLSRPDLLHCLELYAQEEARGGHAYEFRDAEGGAEPSARAALDGYRATGRSPLTQWQTHLFERTPR